MMSYAIFDETFYLASYPDVDAAVKAGMFKSGQEHFEQIGLKEGRVLVSRLYDESFYLQKNPDIAGAVTAGAFKSGLDHFIQFGETEGRAASLLFDEAWYRRRYPDIVPVVEDGTFSSGLQHYILLGEAEGRSSTSFNEFGYFYGFEDVDFDEFWYKAQYPDVAAAVDAGTFTSALQHYIEFGQAEGRLSTPFNNEEFLSAYKRQDYSTLDENVLYANNDVKKAVAAGIFKSGLEHYVEFGQFENREAIFSGTSGNDTVSGFGEQDTLCGVDLSPGPCVSGGTPTGGECLQFIGRGINEEDVLIGGDGKDTFVVSGVYSSRMGKTGNSFYVGGGNADFALIQNFEVGKDAIQLFKGSPLNYDYYVFDVSNENTNIYYTGGRFNTLPTPDLVAVVEGVTALSESDGSLNFIQTVT